MAESKNFPYLHGFSEEEQSRLRQQARFAEQAVYRSVDFSKSNKVLEVGCGVGAQSEILLRRFPEIHLTGVDFNKRQLQAAKEFLAKLSLAEGRYEIHEMDAMNMSFKDNEFDGAFLCWVLEHIPDPAKALSEIKRVLNPGAKVFISEVMNHTFFIDPYSPNVWKYWMAFNDYQYENAGDPFIGAKLGNLLTDVGFTDIKTKFYSWHLDSRHEVRRREQFEYWVELMMSASEQLLKNNCVDEETVEAAKKEMQEVKENPKAVFMYSFMQAEATA